MTTILLTSIGSRSAIGVVDSLARIRHSIRLVATNSNPKAAGNYLADRTVLVPKTAQVDDWRAALTKIIDQEQPAAVIAGRDEELSLLAELRDVFPKSIFLSPNASLVPIFNDKYETYLFAKKHGLPFAESAISASDVQRLIERCGFPIVGKLRRGGHASRSVFLVTNEQQLNACLATGQFVFQETLGPETFADSLASWSGHMGIPWKWSVDSLDYGIDMVLDCESLVASCLSRGHAQGGMHINLELVDDPVMQDTLTRYARIFGSAGHVGPLNLQGKLLPDGRYIPYELNARFVGTTIARTYLGHNLVISALEHFNIIPKCSDPQAKDRSSTYAVERNALFLPFQRSDMDTLIRQGDWSKTTRNDGQ